MNGRNTGLTGRSFHSRSSVDVHSSTAGAGRPVFALHQRRRAVVEPRQHLPGRLRGRRGSRRSGPRRSRRLRGARKSSNTGWLYSSAAEPRRRRSSVRSTGSPGSAGHRVARRARARSRAVPAAMNRPPPAVDERVRRSRELVGHLHRRSATTTACGARSASDTVVGVRVASSTRGDSPIAQRATSGTALCSPRAAAIDHEARAPARTATRRSGRRCRASSRRPAGAPCRACCATATVNGVEGHAARSAWGDVGRERLDRVAVDSRARASRSVTGCAAVIDDAGGDDDAIVILEPRALQRHGRHRQVRRRLPDATLTGVSVVRSRQLARRRGRASAPSRAAGSR